MLGGKRVMKATGKESGGAVLDEREQREVERHGGVTFEVCNLL